ncbi:MAG: 23S rRNA (pseudouridine(1915)-N(3))-methyltransferase RlmH [Acutalibacteraceae bacterium]
MRITVLCVGKCKEAYWRDACAEYQKRLGGFCRLQIVEVEEERAPEAPNASQIEAVVAAEGKRLLDKLPAGAYPVALCIEGRPLSSADLAARLEQIGLDGNSHVAFVIGGSWGLSDAVKQAARWRMSMSPMTFPHQLARVMLLEQIYRAFQISGGGKYHK